MLNGSLYPRNGAAGRCALCNLPLAIEDGHVTCWKGKDYRYYCCTEHANFGLEKALAVVEPLWQKPS